MILKIVHITTVHYRYDVRIHYKYCKALSKEEGLKMDLVVADGKGTEQVSDLKVLDLGRIKFGRIGRVILGNLKVLKFCILNKRDLIHFHDPELLPSMIALRLIGRKLIFDMHEILPLQILTKTYLPKVFRISLSKGVHFFQNIFFRFIPVIFAEFSYAKYFTKVQLQETILNYPLKVEFEAISERKKPHFTLGYMGSVTVERGALVMLEAVAELRKQGEDIHLLFVGPIDDDLECFSVFKEAEQEGWVTFKGRLKPKEGWRYMSQCHIGMAVLQSSPNFIDSYPTKLFEYMLLKLPIITSNFPLYRGIIEDAKCGIVVDPSSVREVSEAILAIKNNDSERVFMGDEGCKRAIEKYSWESSELLKVKSFYNQVLQS
ncbi:glycosyltransferase [Snuella sedimenti]|uniref:Glycosyltransferase n=1 Tax=Snuella sedimenti TaxID=2798802 RepID=A0A8J7LNN2_9FLAO|nr:glycosyltransferase [Snuella sedimenti]MBJ6368158.1 glycosyltransferase [Snuella sedimenti]